MAPALASWSAIPLLFWDYSESITPSLCLWKVSVEWNRSHYQGGLYILLQTSSLCNGHNWLRNMDVLSTLVASAEYCRNCFTNFWVELCSTCRERTHSLAVLVEDILSSPLVCPASTVDGPFSVFCHGALLSDDADWDQIASSVLRDCRAFTLMEPALFERYTSGLRVRLVGYSQTQSQRLHGCGTTRFSKDRIEPLSHGDDHSI